MFSLKKIPGRMGIAFILFTVAGCSSFLDRALRDEARDTYVSQSGGVMEPCSPDQIESGKCWSNNDADGDKEQLKSMLRQIESTSPQQVERIVDRIYK